MPKYCKQQAPAACQWRWHKFDDWTADEAYAVFAARIQVFVVEQACPYQDLDGLDADAWHLCGWDRQTLAAYLRLLPAGARYAEPSIGRVLTADSYRGQGIGQELMQRGIVGFRERFPGADLRISAQHHLEGFYRHLGFATVSEPYQEDGIPHVEMLLENQRELPFAASGVSA